MDPLIPTPRDDDDEDVHWALSTSIALWGRGENAEALKWLRRAAETASDANADDRALELFKAAADVASRLEGRSPSTPAPAPTPAAAVPPKASAPPPPPSARPPPPARPPAARAEGGPPPPLPGPSGARPKPPPIRQPPAITSPRSSSGGSAPTTGSPAPGAPRVAPAAAPLGPRATAPGPSPSGSGPRPAPGPVRPAAASGPGQAGPGRAPLGKGGASGPALRSTLTSGPLTVGTPSQKAPSTKVSTTAAPTGGDDKPSPIEPTPKPPDAGGDPRSAAAKKPVDASRVRARATIERKFQFPHDESAASREPGPTSGSRFDDLDEETSVIETSKAARSPGDPVSRERLSGPDDGAASDDVPTRQIAAAPLTEPRGESEAETWAGQGPATPIASPAEFDIRDEPTREAGGRSLPIIGAIRVFVSIDPDGGVVRVQPRHAGDSAPQGAAFAVLVPATDGDAAAIADLFRVLGET